MEIFTWPVETKPTGTIQMRNRQIQFGEGYVQRVGYGINPRKQEWSVAIDSDYETTQEVIDFLERHKGYIAFQWTPPGRSSALFICERWTEVPHVASQRKIQATFEETYYP